jgi:hypothetical protein
MARAPGCSGWRLQEANSGSVGEIGVTPGGKMNTSTKNVPSGLHPGCDAWHTFAGCVGPLSVRFWLRRRTSTPLVVPSAFWVVVTALAGQFRSGLPGTITSMPRRSSTGEAFWTEPRRKVRRYWKQLPGGSN